MTLHVWMATNQSEFLLLVNMCRLLSIFNYQHVIKTQKTRNVTNTMPPMARTPHLSTTIVFLKMLFHTHVWPMRRPFKQIIWWKHCFLVLNFSWKLQISQNTIGPTCTIIFWISKNHMLTSTLTSSTINFYNILRAS